MDGVDVRRGGVSLSKVMVRKDSKEEDGWMRSRWTASLAGQRGDEAVQLGRRESQGTGAGAAGATVRNRNQEEGKQLNSPQRWWVRRPPAKFNTTCREC